MKVSSDSSDNAKPQRICCLTAREKECCSYVVVLPGSCGARSEHADAKDSACLFVEGITGAATSLGSRVMARSYFLSLRGYIQAKVDQSCAQSTISRQTYKTSVCIP